MIRLLCIVGKMNAGGAETFLMKIYRNLDLTKYQMDFCVADKELGYYDEEIKSMGGKILYTVPKTKGLIKSFKTIKKIVSDGQYKYVMRVSQHSLSGLELIAAKLGGATTTIFRSSNTNTGGGFLNRVAHKLCLPITMLVPNIKIAPSTEAAIFMFGKYNVKKGKVLLLPNALDTNIYAFDEDNRIKYRDKFLLKDKFVIGHVGRFSSQKNHNFLIDVFAEIKKQRPNAYLLLIGTGELEETIKAKVVSLGLSDSVSFLGVRKDIPALLSAMDCFLFPSFFEGMPNTIIEAQTSGLPCVISDTITKEVKVTDLVSFMNLNNDVSDWAKKVIDTENEQQIERSKFTTEMINAGYDISQCVNKFVTLVINGD